MGDHKKNDGDKAYIKPEIRKTKPVAVVASASGCNSYVPLSAEAHTIIDFHLNIPVPHGCLDREDGGCRD